MHPEAMKRLFLLFASSALLACVAHDDTTFQAQPPGNTTGPTRFVVDAGLVTLSDAKGVVLGGGGEQISPEAGVQPDLAPDLAALDAGGIGSPCNLLIQDCPTGAVPLGCYPVNGAGVCQRAGQSPELAACNPQDPDPECAPGMVCYVSKVRGYSCTHFCTLDPNVVGSTCDSSSRNPLCRSLPGSATVGYCSD
jgi:hypothetical protein